MQASGHTFWILILAFVTSVALQSAEIDTPNFCPSFCECDLYNERNRADCSAQRLISPSVDISGTVEILDLSYNDITYLDNSCFQHYYFLQNLSVAHNAIHTIDLDAFSKLYLLEAIDLGYNRLESVDERLFETNRHLQTINLEGNKFLTLPNSPLLRSTSVRTLNLCNSQLSYLSTELFSALPQLQQLDVSQNLMISLNALAFNAPRQLRQVNLDQNRWNCDQTLKLALDRLRQRQIEVTLNDCDFRKSSTGSEIHQPKSERMELVDSEENISKEENETAIPTKNNISKWRQLPQLPENDGDFDYEEQEVKVLVDLSSPDRICRAPRPKLCLRYRKCLEKVSHILLERINSEPAEHVIFTSNDINFVFLLGVAAGMAVVILIMSCALCCKNCWQARRKQSTNILQIEAEGQPPTYATVTANQPGNSSASPPPAATAPPRPLRRSNRRAPDSSYTGQNCRMMARYDVANPHGRDNFISRLFGRPARHQYYRALNQNTVTLIRRLSRSNLFINRERNETTPDSAPSSPLPDQMPETASCSNEASGRPETPPPNYGDIVVVSNAPLGK